MTTVSDAAFGTTTTTTTTTRNTTNISRIIVTYYFVDTDGIVLVLPLAPWYDSHLLLARIYSLDRQKRTRHGEGIGTGVLVVARTRR
jgi:hypothetical protein